MKKIEKYIIENRDEFSTEEPEEGHFERFLDRQQDQRKKRAVFSWKHLMQAAAILLLVTLSSLWLYERIVSPDDEHPSAGYITLADIDPEYRDAEIYYTALINRKYSEIRSFDFNYPEEREVLLKELAEMDSIYKSLEEELNDEGGNQMIVDAMIRHYQLKLEIMSRVLDQLYQVRSAVNDTEKDKAGIIIWHQAVNDRQNG